MRLLPMLILCAVSSLNGAHAQSGGRTPINEPYITSTGETVDKPGQSQSAGTTEMDRNIQRQDNQIDNSICKGC